MDYRIGYVVLHYLALDETVACIESVSAVLKTGDFVIVIDNASPNNSGIELKNRYKNRNDICVLLNSRNLGFARANNIGIRFLREKRKCDFIICLNNDTLIEQKDFRDLILESFEKNKFAVAGPKILNKDRVLCYESPSISKHTTVFFTIIGLFSFVMRWVLSFVNLDLIYSKLVDYQEFNPLSLKYCENVQLLGCCFIFSPLFFEKMEGFDPRTFMYLEEEILYELTKWHTLKSVYDPNIEIIHLGQVSTCYYNRISSGKNRRFRYKEHIKSFFILIKNMFNHMGK